MPKQIIYLRHPLTSVEEGAYQTFGDMVFYPNGGVRLGPAWFAYGTPIHRHRFGANLIAVRSVHDANLLEIEMPAGGQLRFLYRPLFRKWYQMVEANDPRLYLHQQRYGTHVAVVLYYVRWSICWGFFETINFFGFLLLAFLVVLGICLANAMF
ncbi:MAG: hypothetical protein SH868_01000 [Bythopirellula sp.]|nr:hypothetical protein [Bythopirellula sp.]